MQRKQEDIEDQRQNDQAERGSDVIILIPQFAQPDAADARADQQHGERRRQPADERHRLRKDVGQRDVQAENRKAEKRGDDVRVEQYALEADILPPLKQAHADRPRDEKIGDVVGDGVDHPIRIDGQNDWVTHEAAVGEARHIQQNRALVVRAMAEEEGRAPNRRENGGEREKQRQQEVHQHMHVKRALHVIDGQHGQGDVDDELRDPADGFIRKIAEAAAENADEHDQKENDDLSGNGHGKVSFADRKRSCQAPKRIFQERN